MDFGKSFAYMLLGIVVFLLWTSWVKDHQQVMAKQQPVLEEQSLLTPPVIQASSDQANTVQASNQQVNTSNRFIKVKTDVLDVVIDKQGGNLVQVSLLNYPQSLNDKDSFLLLNEKPQSFYVAQSGLVSSLGPDQQNQLAFYSSKQSDYSLSDNQKQLVVELTWQKNGINVSKKFIFNRGQYDVGVDYNVGNKSNGDWSGQFFAQIVRKKVEESKNGFMNISNYEGAAISSEQKHYEKISFKDMNRKELDREIQGGWLAMQQRYFLSAWIPSSKETYHYFSRANENKDIYTIGLMGNKITVAPGQTSNINAKIYVGPEIVENLRAAAPNLDLTIDYGWLWVISSAIFWIMKQIYHVVQNWGWAIILTTVLIKLVFYKLSVASYRSMANMRRLQPKLQQLRERYGDNRQRLNQSVMELYKKEKVNPMGGCLPILIQIPVFIGLYWVLIESVQLRQAPFMGWIHDLSARDPYFILPIIMGITMFIQQRLNPQPADPMQAKVMMALPIIFTFLFLYFPSGLVLYWVVNNVLSILQQWYITSKIEHANVSSKKKLNAY